jgi:primosomal protein N' (replication factor Y)
VKTSSKPYPTTLANKEFGASVSNALVMKGLLAMEWIRQNSTSTAYNSILEKTDVNLTPEQAVALESISKSISDKTKSDIYLLHGVTGSGKTEVYLRAIQKVIDSGRQSLYLVPEISLTPQTVSRVKGRFKERVAVIHSQLTLRQRFDLWWDINDGIYDVIIGPRSALFAPLSDLGLIIIDEEHEWTYKQSDANPRYHARTVALEIAREAKATVILGSATPNIESYHQTFQNTYKLLELPERITHQNSDTSTKTSPMANTYICDMRKELKQGNRSIFSRELLEGLKTCISRSEQAILFINQRGSAPIVQCRDCGHVVQCNRCSVTLTFHSQDGSLLCHKCNRRRKNPTNCPQCKTSNIRQLGIGTQRVVEELRKVLPQITIDRWDSDSNVPRHKSNDAMHSLQIGRTQVLVGTQVVAKGLDIPNVTLVGAILADIGLHIPDFRSGERTFNTLCQLAGRSGRGNQQGTVIIQTYNPDKWPIICAAKQNYNLMFENEIAERRAQGNPPFNDIIHLVYHDLSVKTAQHHANTMCNTLNNKIANQGITDIEVIGPAPGFPERIRGSYRWHIILRGRNMHRFLEGINFSSKWIVDVDPSQVV